MSHCPRIFALAAAGLTALVAAAPLHAWISGGVPVCVIEYEQSDPVIVSDGAGGAIVVWRGPHDTGDFDIYAQRLDARGNPLWTENGVPVCNMLGAQSTPVAVSDGAGGAIVAWIDNRDGSWDIRAQRLGPDGDRLWALPDIPIVVFDYEQSNVRILSDGAGGAFLVWHDYRGDSWDIRAQRISVDGNAQWSPNGSLVCDAASSQVFPQMTADGAGGIIVTWQDSRAVDPHIYAQRMDGTGSRLWGDWGVPVCTASIQQNLPHIVSDGAGGAVITWYDTRVGFADIYAQRVSGAGACLWTADGVCVCNEAREQYNPRLASDGAGGAIITWYDYRSSLNYDIYAKRLDASGATVWSADVCVASYDQKNPRIVPDGAGGAIVVWESGDLYMQRYNAAGEPLWGATGVPLCSETGNQQSVDLLMGPSGRMMAAWDDDRGADGDIYAALFDANGEPVATLLKRFTASCRDGAVEVRWELSELVDRGSFVVSRIDAGRPESAGERLAIPVEETGLSYSFRDKSVSPGETFLYRVSMMEDGAPRMLFETAPVTVPASRLALHQNHPNPFNPSTTISFTLPAEREVTLDVHDASGRVVARILDGETLGAGLHEVEWSGLGAAGEGVASGVYFCRLRAGKETLVRKMVLAR